MNPITTILILMYCLGAYPCLQFRLQLYRSSSYYVITIVFPSVVVVVLSWSSFFVPTDFPAAKLSVALVTALSSLGLHILCRAVLAPDLGGIPYVTVIDVWLVSCLLFVLFSLIIQLIVISRASGPHQVSRSKVNSFPSHIGA